MGQGTFESESERGIRLNKLRNGGPGATPVNHDDPGNRIGMPEISPMSTKIFMQPSKQSIYEPDRPMSPSGVTRFI